MCKILEIKFAKTDKDETDYLNLPTSIEELN